MFIIYSRALQRSFYVNFIQNLLHKKKARIKLENRKSFQLFGLCERLLGIADNYSSKIPFDNGMHILFNQNANNEANIQG